MGSMALHSQALLLPYSETSISNTQLHRLYRPTPIRPKWRSGRLVVASAAPRRKEPSKEISLDQHDLMALEFGRLLGESKEKTISKVLRRKVDPGSTYIGIEKQVKGGKGLISNTDFAVKVERPTRGSRNASTLSPDLPGLTSPPSRQNGSSINLPKLGSKLASYADTEEIMLDDSLLRKPSSSQDSRAMLPPSTPIAPGINNVKMLDSQFKSVLEEDSEDLERLRRPSMAKEKEAGKMFSDSSDRVKNTKFSSQRSEVSSTLENSDSMEVSKLEFQRLLDESFNSSSVSSLPKLASPPAAQNNSSRKFIQTTQQDFRVKLSSPKRPLLQNLSSKLDGDQQLDLQGDESWREVEEKFQHKQNVAPALPHLASPPSRDKGSVGTFVEPARARDTATPSYMRGPTSDGLEEPLLRKPKDQASNNVNLSSMQHSEGFYNPGDDEPLQSSKASLQGNLDKPSAVPHLAAPPSRHKGSFGTFVAPGRLKIRGVESPSKEPIDEVVDESLLRKPSHLEKERDSLDSTSLTEANSAPLSFSSHLQLEDKVIDDSLLRRPTMEADASQADVEISDQLDGLKQEGGSQLGGKASQLRPQADLLQDFAFEEELLKGDHMELLKDNAQSSDLENSLQVLNGSNVGQNVALSTDSEQEPEPVFKIETSVQSQEEFSGLDGASQLCNDVSDVSLSGGLQDVDHSSGVKRVKVAALKKPVRVTSSDSKVYASESKSVQLDSSQDSGLSSDVTQQSLNSNANGEDGNLDIGSDLRSLQSECEAEESKGSQSLAEAISVTRFLPQKVSVEDQERDQVTCEQLIAAIDQTTEILLDEASYPEATKEDSTDNLLQQSKEMLRRPSQISYGDLSTQRSKQMDLQASNTKLHQAKEEEEKEWARAEALLKSKEQVEVKLIGSNSAGLFVSFGCLVGFLPSFELSPKRGLIDFASWAQKNGIDLSQNGGLLRNIVIDASQSSTVQNVENNKPTTAAEGDFNELKSKYKEEISKLMSSFVGEKTKVIVKLLDKSRRKLKFSEKEADPGCREHVQKKANLMAELKLGDVVTCEVKSITPIGVFVEVDSVPALIHHSEVSWNTRVDPASLLNIGQVIKAKVCRLDRILQRINLSLKQMQTDPLKRTLESVVGDSESDSSICKLEAIESMDVFWPQLEDLIKKLEKMDQISSVSKGRCLYSAAFAPTFQVLISTPQSNGYKLLARFGNKIQEILVDTTLDRDKMKDRIRICTFSDD